jgi:hypothetical protein
MALIGTLTQQQLIVTGIAPSYTAASGDGHYFNNDGRVMIQIKNAGVQTVATFATPYSSGGNAVADMTVTVPATTGDKMIGPFQPEIFNDVGGRVYITFSSTASVTLAAFRL